MQKWEQARSHESDPGVALAPLSSLGPIREMPEPSPMQLDGAAEQLRDVACDYRRPCQLY